MSCKLGFELATVQRSAKGQSAPKWPNWFCHFDDDSFVNFGQLKALVAKFDPDEDHYLGKHSVAHPIKLQYSFGDEAKRMSQPFMFGTGGAGWCLSRSLLRKTIIEIRLTDY